MWPLPFQAGGSPDGEEGRPGATSSLLLVGNTGVTAISYISDSGQKIECDLPVPETFWMVLLLTTAELRVRPCLRQLLQGRSFCLNCFYEAGREDEENELTGCFLKWV